MSYVKDIIMEWEEQTGKHWDLDNPPQLTNAEIYQLHIDSKQKLAKLIETIERSESQE